MEYFIQSTPKGYVVRSVKHQLRNFGWLQSAAIEFRDYCNTHIDEAQEKRYAQTYNEDDIYTWPEIKGGMCTLRKQRK